MRLERRIRPMDDTHGQFYLNLHVEDGPGVLAEIADHFGRNGVSIERVWQEGSATRPPWCSSPTVPRRVRSRTRCSERRDLRVVRAISSVLRVEGEE